MERKRQKMIMFAAFVAITASVAAYIMVPQAIANPQIKGSEVDLSKFAYYKVGSNEYVEKMASKYGASDASVGLQAIDEKSVNSKTIVLFANSEAIAKNETLARSKMIALLNNHAKLVMVSDDPQDIRSFTQMIGAPAPSQDTNFYGKTSYPEGAQCYVKQGKVGACPIEGGTFMGHIEKDGGGAERALQLWLGKEL